MSNVLLENLSNPQKLSERCEELNKHHKNELLRALVVFAILTLVSVAITYLNADLKAGLSWSDVIAGAITFVFATCTVISFAEYLDREPPARNITKFIDEKVKMNGDFVDMFGNIGVYKNKLNADVKEFNKAATIGELVKLIPSIDTDQKLLKFVNYLATRASVNPHRANCAC